MIEGVVTWEMAENALLEALELQAALPDREAAFLSAGSRSSWPEVLREVRKGEYPGSERPRRQLTGYHLWFIKFMLEGERAVLRVLDPPEPVLDENGQPYPQPEQMLARIRRRNRLVGRVLIGKLDGRGEGFSWERIWEMEDREARLERGERPASVAWLKQRYEAAMELVAARMAAMGFGAGAGAGGDVEEVA